MLVPINLPQLCKKIGYQFNNIAYLKQALTHCSAGNENNERLEFLGDSILSFVIAHALFQRFKEESEGQLSRLRALLVKGETLAEIAIEIKLGDYLFLGQGELKSGGFRRASILSDALEAVFAAVYLDGGMDACQHVILKLFTSRLDNKELRNNLKDSKTQLQEFLQANKKPLPDYTLIKIEGEEHEQVFFISCTVKGITKSATGFGSNRRRAEQEAAKQLLELLKK